jgi:ABC-type bacteriocin/lantibiotic exporter with double-glycine peptidase domain
MAIYSRGTALISLFFCLAGCAALAPSPSPGKVALDLPFEAQAQFNLCGLASLDMLARFYKRPISPASALLLRQEAAAKGAISGNSMKSALEEDGFQVAVFPGTLDRGLSGLYRHLDLGRPLIVMTGLQPRHYEVVVGYDEAKALVLVLDPALGPQEIPGAEFQKDWQEANRFTLLALPIPEASAGPKP